MVNTGRITIYDDGVSDTEAIKIEIFDDLDVTHHLGNISNISNTISRKEHSSPAVYAIISNSTDKIYVGSTEDLYIRANKHRTSLSNGVHRNKNLQKVFNEDPNFSISFTHTETKEEATIIEQRMLDNMSSTGRLLNISPDAFIACKGITLSDAAKEHLRQKTIQQFSTQEARDAHSQISKRLWQDPEFRHKQESRVMTQEQIELNRKHTTELWQKPEFRCIKRNRRSVIVNGDYYPSLKLAADATNITDRTIMSRIRDTSPKFSDYSYV
jgi:group I intron endonuclease